MLSTIFLQIMSIPLPEPDKEDDLEALDNRYDDRVEWPAFHPGDALPLRPGASAASSSASTLYQDDGINITESRFARKDHPAHIAVIIDAGKSLLQEIDQTDPLAMYRADNVYYPFADDVDWEIAKWMTDSSLSNSQINSFLKLKYVCGLSCH